MVDGKVGFHCPQLMVLEGGPHAFGLLCWRVGLLVPVQVIGVIFVTALEGTERGTGGVRVWIQRLLDSKLIMFFAYFFLLFVCLFSFVFTETHLLLRSFFFFK